MIYLLRHCEADGAGTDAPLTAAGATAADALVEALRPLDLARIVASPALRAQASARPTAEALGLPLLVDPSLAEHRLGTVVPDLQSVFRRVLAERGWRPPMGESQQDVIRRGRAAVEMMSRRPGNSLLATHGRWLTIVLSSFGPKIDLGGWEAMPRPALFRLEGRHWAAMELPS